MTTPLTISDLGNKLNRYVFDYADTFNETNWWREPLLAAGRVDERFEMLPKIATGNHWLPTDLLETAKTVIVFFIPFRKSLIVENHEGKYPCENWGIAYDVTNELIERAGEHLKFYLNRFGYKVALTPATENFDPEKLVARWSHKHLGYLCNLGRFGINAQFITPAGCSGRLGSFVTDADFGDRPLVEEKELCLYKNGKECLRCVSRCPVKAISTDGIDRHRCNKHLGFIRNYRNKLGIGARTKGCAKCQVNLPCSMVAPTP